MVKRRKTKKRRAPRVQAERICSTGLAMLLSGRPTMKCTMGDAVKLLWAHAKQNGLSSGGTILCDPAMRRLFGVEQLGMTEVFGAIAKQMTGAAAAAEEAAGVAAASGQGRGAALVSAARDEGPVLSVSAELTALFGEGGGVAGARARLTQAEALRKLGAYCSRNKLRDTVDRRQVRCDVALARVLGCASFTVYEAKALLARHMSSDAPSRAAGGSEGGGGSGGSDGGGSSSGSTASRPGTSASDAGPSAAPYQPPPVTAATNARADGGAAGAAAQLEVARLRRAVRAPRGRSWCRARDKPTPNLVPGLALALAVTVACPWSGARGQGGATRAAAGGGGQQ